jgi:hypothetical protein
VNACHADLIPRLSHPESFQAQPPDERRPIMASNRRALCVGINKFKNYPSAALQGCVNDTRDMTSVLKDFLGFTREKKSLTEMYFFSGE